MKFTVVSFRNFNKDQFVPFGVIVQSESDLLFKFDLSDARFDKIHELSPDVDPETFKSFEKTFKANFIDVDSFDISDDYGNKVSITKTNPRFLDYLYKSYQSNYQYSTPTPIEGDEPSEYLNKLFDLKVSQI